AAAPVRHLRRLGPAALGDVHQATVVTVAQEHGAVLAQRAVGDLRAGPVLVVEQRAVDVEVEPRVALLVVRAAVTGGVEQRRAVRAGAVEASRAAVGVHRVLDVVEGGVAVAALEVVLELVLLRVQIGEVQFGDTDLGGRAGRLHERDVSLGLDVDREFLAGHHRAVDRHASGLEFSHDLGGRLGSGGVGEVFGGGEAEVALDGFDQAGGEFLGLGGERVGCVRLQGLGDRLFRGRGRRGGDHAHARDCRRGQYTRDPCNAATAQQGCAHVYSKKNVIDME